jgi:hypothetical protein
MENNSGEKDFRPIFATLIVFVPVLALVILGIGTALGGW